MNIFNPTLFILALPYLGLAAYDLWMHNHERLVPKLERILHNVILPLIIAFIVLACFGFNQYAKVVMLICFPCMLIDEVVYHKDLHIKEKRVHQQAGLSLIVFTGYWLWMI